MSQHDMVIDNGPGLTVRTDMNAAIQALVTNSAGPVEPTVMYAGMLWLDTSVAPDGKVRQRNQANSAWIDPVFFNFDEGAQTIEGPLTITEGPLVVDGHSLAPTALPRNRLINGAMQISQENGNAIGTTSSYHIADQWLSFFSSSSTVSVRRWAAAGTQQPYYFGVTASPAETAAAAGEFIQLVQVIEGGRINDLMLGTASSQQFVIAFDVNISVAGTYWVAFIHPSNTHSFLASYTIAAGELGQWVRKSVVVPAGAINAGTWPMDNSAGAMLRFVFHCGSTYIGIAGFQPGLFLAGPGQALGLSTAAGCYVTNVGLYLDPDGTGLPPKWEMPDEAEELRACQRYWERSGAYGNMFSGNTTASSGYIGSGNYLVEKRTAASLSGVNGNNSSAFPAVVGSLSGDVSSYSENRTASVTGNGGFYRSTIIANARM